MKDKISDKFRNSLIIERIIDTYILPRAGRINLLNELSSEIRKLEQLPSTPPTEEMVKIQLDADGLDFEECNAGHFCDCGALAKNQCMCDEDKVDDEFIGKYPWITSGEPTKDKAVDAEEWLEQYKKDNPIFPIIPRYSDGSLHLSKTELNKILNQFAQSQSPNLVMKERQSTESPTEDSSIADVKQWCHDNLPDTFGLTPDQWRVFYKAMNQFAQSQPPTEDEVVDVEEEINYAVIIKHPFRDTDYRVDMYKGKPDSHDEIRKLAESKMLGPFEVISVTTKFSKSQNK